jgi:hypothetical protein
MIDIGKGEEESVMLLLAVWRLIRHSVGSIGLCTAWKS